MYSDPVDASSAVYSLLLIGQERFVAGGAQHSLIKVFDLRMPGQRLYHAANTLPCSQQRFHPPKRRESSQFTIRCGIWGRCPFHASIGTPRNWNVFLGTRSFGHEQSLESSVYSLSRPSSVSPTIYAGVQNWVTQLDLVSVLDRHPDPIHNIDIPNGAANGYPDAQESFYVGYQNEKYVQEAKRIMNDTTRKWDPEEQALNLTMYEQADQVSAVD